MFTDRILVKTFPKMHREVKQFNDKKYVKNDVEYQNTNVLS